MSETEVQENPTSNVIDVSKERPYAFYDKGGYLNFAFKIPDDERWKSFYNNPEARELVETNEKGDPVEHLIWCIQWNLMHIGDKETLEKEREALSTELDRQLDEILKSVGITSKPYRFKIDEKKHVLYPK